MDQIGLFGGTFNPIHNGHLRAALEVKTHFGLKKILLIPAAIPPHKKGAPVAGAADRLEMLRLAAAGTPDFEISGIELQRSGPSYTIDTVNQFKKIFPQSSRLFLIIGCDAFLEIHTWHFYRDLLQSIPFIIISRPGSTRGDNREEIGTYLKSQISADYEFSPDKACYRPQNGPLLFICSVTTLDISSTRIRELLKQGESIRFLVPPQVEDFIQRKGLYR